MSRSPTPDRTQIEVVRLQDLWQEFTVEVASQIYSSHDWYKHRFCVEVPEAEPRAVVLSKLIYTIEEEESEDVWVRKDSVLQAPVEYFGGFRYLLFYYHSWVGVLYYTRWSEWVDAVCDEQALLEMVYAIKAQAVSHCYFTYSVIAEIIEEGGHKTDIGCIELGERIRHLDSWLLMQWKDCSAEMSWDDRENLVDPLSFGQWDLEIVG